MQLIADKRLATARHRENRFPLDAFWEMGIYSLAKTSGFTEYAQIQFSHRWVNWESILAASIRHYVRSRGMHVGSPSTTTFVNGDCGVLKRRGVVEYHLLNRWLIYWSKAMFQGFVDVVFLASLLLISLALWWKKISQRELFGPPGSVVMKAFWIAALSFPCVAAVSSLLGQATLFGESLMAIGCLIFVSYFLTRTIGLLMSGSNQSSNALL
ncbi:hypothetical protein [Aeoliella mucimassa]|uniref:Uncharacterized protein n=1 Tax=Aeoliella mucimassa TaxID=2527972 RepID=A0A518AV76_9BACT|nr:hypothetical protein [Aeoliella mucimassa]QDU58613.1 hypothetical protein Pan181_48520 [Aeoliella mucimassa]